MPRSSGSSRTSHRSAKRKTGSAGLGCPWGCAWEPFPPRRRRYNATSRSLRRPAIRRSETSPTSGIAELRSIQASSSRIGTSSRRPTRTTRISRITWRSKLSRETDRTRAASSIDNANRASPRRLASPWFTNGPIAPQTDEPPISPRIRRTHVPLVLQQTLLDFWSRRRPHTHGVWAASGPESASNPSPDARSSGTSDPGANPTSAALDKTANQPIFPRPSSSSSPVDRALLIPLFATTVLLASQTCFVSSHRLA